MVLLYAQLADCRAQQSLKAICLQLILQNSITFLQNHMIKKNMLASWVIDMLPSSANK